VSVERFMRQRAVNVTVDGSYTLQRWYDAQGKIRTLACRTTRVSPYRMIVQVPVVGRVGDRVTSHFDAFGAFEGSVSDTMDGSFLLELEMAHDQRARLSERLTWLEKRQKDPSILEQRDNARVIPKDPHTTLTLADGSVYRCFIIDMSPTGAAVSPSCGRRSGCHLRSAPASAAWSACLRPDSPSSSSKRFTSRICRA
jgi:hypothetical protein